MDNYTEILGTVNKKVFRDYKHLNKLFSTVTSMKDKTVGQRLNACIDAVHTPLEIKGYLLTAEYHPESSRIDDWNRVQKDLMCLISKFEQRKDFVYAVSTIEVHPYLKDTVEARKPVRFDIESTSQLLEEEELDGLVGLPIQKPKTQIMLKKKATKNKKNKKVVQVEFEEDLDEEEQEEKGKDSESVLHKYTIQQYDEETESKLIYREVMNFFSEHDHKLDFVRSNHINDTKYEMILYTFMMDHFMDHKKSKNPESKSEGGMMKMMGIVSSGESDEQKKNERNKRTIEDLNSIYNEDCNVDIKTYILRAYKYLLQGGIKEPAKLSMSGYPHIHVALFLNRTVNIDVIAREIMSLDIFYDINTKTKGRAAFSNEPSVLHPDNDSRIIQYIIKNTKDQIPSQRLNELPCTLHNPKKIKEVDYLFQTSLKDDRLKVVINGVPTNHDLDIIEELEKPTLRFKAEQIGKKKVIIDEDEDEEFSNNYLEQKVKTKSDVAWKLFTDYMIKNDLYVLSIKHTHPNYTDNYRDIYKKLPASKNTFVFFGNASTIFDEIIFQDNVHLFTEGEQRRIESNLKYKNLYRSINLEYQWVEFKDFFLHLNTGTISTIIPDEPSFYYNPNITLETLKTLKHNTPLINEYLRFQEVLDDNYDPKTKGDVALLNSMYNIFRLRGGKFKTPALYGPSGSGKSALIKAILSIYPTSKVGTMTLNSDFALSKSSLVKQVLFLDEFDKAVVKNSMIPMLKQALDGDCKMSINVKGKEAVDYTPEFRSVICCNDVSWSTKMNQDISANERRDMTPKELEISKQTDPAFECRLEFRKFKPLVNPDLTIMKKLICEGPYFILRLTQLYFGERAFKEIEKEELEVLEENLEMQQQIFDHFEYEKDLHFLTTGEELQDIIEIKPKKTTSSDETINVMDIGDMFKFAKNT